MAGIGDFIEVDTERELHVMNVEYTEEHGDPVVHLFCRGEDGEQHWVEVVGHRPSFFVHEDAVNKRLYNHTWVENIEGGHESIRGENLVQVETGLPWHVGGKRDTKGLREYYDQTWEADVFYTSRFLIDTDIYTHVRFDEDDTWSEQYHDGDYRIHVDDIEAVEDPDWRATPRMVTVDIEVLSPDGFPEPSDADQPVTVITAYDNYDENYVVWVLRHHGWAYGDDEIRAMVDDADDVRVFEEESTMLHDFNGYVGSRQPDLLSGWNSSATDNGDAFDYPYLVNRCQDRNVSSYQDWSPMGQVWTTRKGRGQNLTVGGKGVEAFDMMAAYKKTQWSEPKGGWSLENIAATELDYGKEDIEDIDDAYRNDPETFLQYNVRDVSAVVEIDEAAGVVELFQNIRELAGVQFGDCHNPIDMLDILFLRHAKEEGMALPTNESPDRDWYYGAFVFNSRVGRHRNVVYFDVSSLYPNIMRQTNISPETIVGTAEELEASQYTEDDCQWAYVDTRPTNVKKDTDSPQFEKFYYLKPSVKEGFIKSVVDELLELKDFYDGTELYSAVKRLVNAVYGVLGDANSYGKGFRLFDWRMAESITLQGRKIIQECADWATTEIDGGVVTNGDTDGVGVTMGDEKSHIEAVGDAIEMEEEMTDYIQSWCEDAMNIEQSTIAMEAEKLMDPLFIPEGKSTDTPKKRYAYLTVWEQ